MRAAVASVLVLCALWPQRADARADFLLTTSGTGFTDPTPVVPLGGNAGTTRGEQRRRALARALEIWGAALDSEVPIAVSATFPDLSCTNQGAVLGQAFATQYVRGLFGVAEGPYYPSALGDRIVGYDISPDTADITIELNAALDGTECESVAGRWYYGLDGKGPSGQNDLIQVALHELAHGLGFASSIDPATGASQYAAATDVFSAHILDLDLGTHWDALSDAQRASSAGNLRRLVFDGEEAQRMARTRLARGEPTLSLSPMPPDATLSRAVSDVELAVDPAGSPVSGKLVLANPTDVCAGPFNDVRGAVVLLENGPDCLWQAALARLSAAGAVGAVFVVSSPADAPAEPLDAYGVGTPVSLPAVTVSAPTGIAIANALSDSPITASLAGDPQRWLGADAEGRPLLFASRPSLRGSSISHFDSLARPNLLMEAYVQGGSNHDVDLTLAVLRDIGWRSDCGNGKLDGNEQCDLGAANADTVGTGCRTTCRLPGCGDGTRDVGEACDEGAGNNDLDPDACRTDCQLAHCGDGVMDSGEVCDQGIANSDTTPDACRADCTLPRCGDGVRDQGEACDRTPGCPASCKRRVDAGALPGDGGMEPWSDQPAPGGSHHSGCALGGGGGGAWFALWLLLRSRRFKGRG